MVFVKVENVLVFELDFWRNGSVIELLLVRFQSVVISDLIKKPVTYSLLNVLTFVLIMVMRRHPKNYKASHMP